MLENTECTSRNVCIIFFFDMMNIEQIARTNLPELIDAGRLALTELHA